MKQYRILLPVLVSLVKNIVDYWNNCIKATSCSVAAQINAIAPSDAASTGATCFVRLFTPYCTLISDNKSARRLSGFNPTYSIRGKKNRLILREDAFFSLPARKDRALSTKG